MKVKKQKAQVSKFKGNSGLLSAFSFQLSASFARMLERFGFVKIPGGSGSGGGYAGFTGWTNVGSREEQLKSYQNHVYKCVTVIYRRAVSIPWQLYKERQDEDEQIRQHPFIDLMWRPNPYMTGTHLHALTQMHLDLCGMAFWLKIRNGLGKPVELWPLSPGLFSQFVLSDARTDLVAYEFQADTGAIVRYGPEDIVYFHYPHPAHWLEGASPIQAMAYSYDIDLASRVYQRNFFQQSARPDVTLETDQDIQPEDARRLLIAWKESHQGVSKAWEPAILDKGLKANILTVANKDMEFASLAEWTKRDILEAYGVPEGKLGSVRDVNKANALGIDITFNSECIKPRLTMYDEVVSLYVVAEFDPTLYVEHDECVPRDEAFDLTERETNLRMKLTTINEERGRMGMDPVSWGNAPWVSIAEFQYGDELEIVQEGKAQSAERKAESENQEQKGKEEEQDAVRHAPCAERKGRSDRIRLLHERRVAMRSRVFQKYLRKFFRAQQADVLKNLDENFPKIDGILAGMSIPKAKKWLDEHKDETERILFDLNQANQSLAEGAGPYIEASLISGAEEALAIVGSQAVTFDIFSERASSFMGDKLKKIGDVNQTTRNSLRDAIRAGFEAGETRDRIAARIREIFANADQVRSLRIAQTEVQSAANFGSLEGYQQSGVVEKKEWVAGPDARATHQAAAAKYRGDGAIPLRENFVVGAGSGPAPGNIGRPEEDINCRCTIVPVVRQRASLEESENRETAESGNRGIGESESAAQTIAAAIREALANRNDTTIFNVNVAQPDIAPPQVHVDGPVVNVKPPNVSVTTPPVEVHVDARSAGKKEIVYHRNKEGDLVKAELVEE